MKTSRLFALPTLIILFVAVMLVSPTHAQDSTDEDLKSEVYVAINRSLLDAGARPLGQNDALDAVAQTIADELSVSGSYTSAPRALADENGYPRWSDGGQRVITEAINYIGVESPDFFAQLRQDDLINTLQNTFYREMGVGISTYQAVTRGTVQNVYVVVMGAQPNMLPVIINSGEETVYDRDVMLYLHNELSLAYETEPDVIQQAVSVRIANSEAELDAAEPMAIDGDEFAFPWTLTEEFGAKEVWVAFEDEKGASVVSNTTVVFADPASAPSDSVPTPTATLNMMYAGDTFTLSVSGNMSTVRLQEVYFQWEVDGFTRAYEIENPDDMQNVDLESFTADNCIQIRWAGVPETVNVDGCGQIFLEARRFTDLNSVFWGHAGGSFDVWDGPRLLGTCDNDAGSCSVTLR